MSREVVNFTIARFGRVAPEDLLGKSCGHHLSAALIYSPEACQVARIDAAGFTVVDRDSETERPADLSSAYEIRAFGKKAELRWLREGKTGTATLLADGSVEGQPDSTDTDTTIDVLPRTYRVWGEPPKARDGVPPRPIAGWTKLTAGGNDRRWARARTQAWDLPLAVV
jgi:CRISPR-associated protein (TIGR03984 family)